MLIKLLPVVLGVPPVQPLIVTADDPVIARILHYNTILIGKTCRPNKSRRALLPIQAVIRAGFVTEPDRKGAHVQHRRLTKVPREGRKQVEETRRAAQ